MVIQREHFLSPMFPQFQQIYIESYEQEHTMQVLVVQKCPYTKFLWFHSTAHVCLGASETMKHRPWQECSTDHGCKYSVSCCTRQLQALHLMCQCLFGHQLQPKLQWHRKNAHFLSPGSHTTHCTIPRRHNGQKWQFHFRIPLFLEMLNTTLLES